MRGRERLVRAVEVVVGVLPGHLGLVGAPGDRHDRDAEERHDGEVEAAANPAVVPGEVGLLARVLHRRDPTGLVVSGFPFGTDAAELLRAEWPS